MLTWIKCEMSQLFLCSFTCKSFSLETRNSKKKHITFHFGIECEASERKSWRRLLAKTQQRMKVIGARFRHEIKRRFALKFKNSQTTWWSGEYTNWTLEWMQCI